MRCKRRQILHAQPSSGILTLGIFVVFCGLYGCANETVAAKDGQAAPAPETSQADAFSRLNRISARSKLLHNPVAAYKLYLESYVHSDGLLHNLLGQVVAATESELGNYRQAIVDYPLGAPRLKHPPQPLPNRDRARAVAAVDAITALARQRRIVMVNEAHHAAQTRLLTLQLLPRLRKLGFNYFAAEALDENDHDLQARGYPVHNSGTYVREPIYADMIRKAIRLGYHVIAYDTTRKNSDPSQREQDQADHLRRRVFEVDPDARLFIHAGYAHVDKSADYFYTDTLAMRLKRDTGYDPLSVDQTLLRELAPGREYAGYRTLVRRFDPHGPTVILMRNSGRPWSLEPDVYDVSVLLPPTRWIDGRPDWLTLDGQRQPVAIENLRAGLSLPFLIEARHANESANAVAADRLLITSRETPAVMFLRPGVYRIDLLDASGRPRALRRLRVPTQTALGSG